MSPTGRRRRPAPSTGCTSGRRKTRDRSHGKGVKRLKGGNMPAGFTRVIALATLTAVLTLPLAAAQPSNPTRPASRVPQEPHPQIVAPTRAPEAARLHLQRAAHDCGRHRVKAPRASDAALVRPTLALPSDV